MNWSGFELTHDIDSTTIESLVLPPHRKGQHYVSFVSRGMMSSSRLIELLRALEEELPKELSSIR